MNVFIILQTLLVLIFPVTMIGWTPDNEVAFYQEISLLVDKIGGVSVFESVYGHITVTLYPSDEGRSCWSSLNCYGDISLVKGSRNEGILLHELGHVFLNNLGLRSFEYSIGYYEEGKYIHVSGLNPITMRHERTSLGYPHAGFPYEQHGAAVSQSKLEDFADMFRAWVLDDFTDDPAGNARKEFMDRFVADALMEKSLSAQQTIEQKLFCRQRMAINLLR
jgi:hypothetical protein